MAEEMLVPASVASAFEVCAALNVHAVAVPMLLARISFWTRMC